MAGQKLVLTPALNRWPMTNGAAVPGRSNIQTTPRFHSFAAGLPDLVAAPGETIRALAGPHVGQNHNGL
jgi:hypothetical protein